MKYGHSLVRASGCGDVVVGGGNAGLSVAAHLKKADVSDIRIVLVLPTPAMFGVPAFAEELERVVARYGIEVHKNNEFTEIDPRGPKATITSNADTSSEVHSYDLLHVVPPQSTPDWIKASPLADRDNPGGYAQIDKNTLRHNRFDTVFALGDAAHPRTPRPGPRSASGPPWSSRTCPPA